VELSHQVEAGADFFVMPSRYEPCGLNQMYSLRYGTVPIVRATGGLDDTVLDLNEPDPTGIKFGPFHADSLFNALGRARELYHDAARLDEVRRRGMRQDFSWRASAKRYETLFESLLGR
jgi:starch synthase